LDGDEPPALFRLFRIFFFLLLLLLFVLPVPAFFFVLMLLPVVVVVDDGDCMMAVVGGRVKYQVSSQWGAKFDLSLVIQEEKNERKSRWMETCTALPSLPYPGLS
jgi:hypothetical protein